MTNATSASRKGSKHRVFWKDLLSLHFRKDANQQHHVLQPPIISTSKDPSLSSDSSQIPRNLVRSNARAKSPKNSQTHKTAGMDNRLSTSNKEDKHGIIASRTPSESRDATAQNHTKVSIPSPPPYVLSLPEAVIQPPSLVALTNDELRSRGIYSPHQDMDLGSVRIQPGMSRASMSRNTSLRSALSMFAPRLGLRPAPSSSNLLSHSGSHSRNHPSSLASTTLSIGVCISVMMISLDRGSITTAIPSIFNDFSSSQDMGWYACAYFLAASAFQPMYGRVYSSFNIKWSFLGAVVIFQLGALLCATAPSSEIFILGRAVQGLGNAGISTGSLAIVTHSFDQRWRSTLLAFLDVLSWLGAIAGPILGGIFVQLLSWRWCYYLNLVLAGTILACVPLCSHSWKSRNPHPNLVHQTSDFSSTGKTFVRRALALDWIGGFLLIASFTFLFLALQLTQRKDFDRLPSAWIIFASLSATFLLLFVLWMQIRGDNALIPFHVLRQRTVAASCAAAFFLYGSFTIHIYFFPIWFRASKQQSAIESGVSMVPYMLAMALLSLVFGHFAFGGGRLALFTALGCGIATIGAGLITMLNPEASVSACIGYQIVIAAGLGLGMQKVLSAVQIVLPPHEASIGIAIVIACQNAGGATLVSVGNVLFQKFLFQDDKLAGPETSVNLDLGLGIILPEQVNSDIRKLYIDALRTVFIAVIPLCGIAFLFSMCMEWNIVQDDQIRRTPGLMNMQGINRGFNSPELGSDAPTLAHLAPRARHRWSQRWSVPITDFEIGPRLLSTALQELNDSKSSLLSIEDATSEVEIKEMEIGIAVST